MVFWSNFMQLEGHEGCGEVVVVGSEVTEYQVGDMVSVLAVAGCGEASCPECTKDVAQICIRGERYGIGHDGSFAPYIAIKARAAVRLPEGVSVAAGAVATDAVMTAYHAVVGRAQAQKSDTVLLYGLGGLGFNALQILLNIGARVIVVDKRQAVLDDAVKFGVKPEDVVPASTTDVAKWVREKHLVIDTVIDFVGAPDSFQAAISAVRLAGTVVLIGLLNPNLSFHSVEAVRKQLNILCSYGGTHVDLRASLDLVAKGIIKPQVETGRLEDFPKVLADLHAGKIKSRIALVPEGVSDSQARL
ncbi:hypothetical protein LTR84_000279 [Exophiala bonariae]|uniref:Enoyl reductase (ER) domain-containing protein n=1 Tax=Exophiala bonariae TaxID=1690606 RepID=A0AAV9NQ42_9EURO|nr:hypothetical protein LTR84_000279 [Exophiala bonariae]